MNKLPKQNNTTAHVVFLLLVFPLILDGKEKSSCIIDP